MEAKCVHCGNFGPALSNCGNCGKLECARCYGDCLLKKNCKECKKSLAACRCPRE